MHSLSRVLLLVVPVLATFATGLSAQGVTTAALFGTVTGSDSTALEDAVVTVTNTATGERWQTATGSSRIREAVAMVCDSRSAPMISKPGRGRSGYRERDGAGVGEEAKV